MAFLCNTLAPLCANQGLTPLVNSFVMPQLTNQLVSNAPLLLAQCMAPASLSAAQAGSIPSYAPLSTHGNSSASMRGTNSSSESQIDDLSPNEIQVLHALQVLSNPPVRAQPSQGTAVVPPSTAAPAATSPLACTDSGSPSLLSAAAAAARSVKDTRPVASEPQHTGAPLEARRTSQSLSDASHDTRTRGIPLNSNATGAAHPEDPSPGNLATSGIGITAEPSGRGSCASSPQKRIRLSSDAILAWGLQAARAAAAGLPEPSLPEGLQDLAPLDTKRRRSAAADLTPADVPKTGPFSLLRHQRPSPNAFAAHDSSRVDGLAPHGLASHRLSEGTSRVDSSVQLPAQAPLHQPLLFSTGRHEPPAPVLPPLKSMPLLWPAAPPESLSSGTQQRLPHLQTQHHSGAALRPALAPAPLQQDTAVAQAIAALRPQMVQLVLSLLQGCTPPVALPPQPQAPLQPLSPTLLHALTSARPQQLASDDPRRLLESLLFPGNPPSILGASRPA
jgi:hypothetical protein